jgi:hypothetical protein
MSPAEYRAAIAELGLSQVRAAEFFGVHDVTGRWWAAVDGDGPPAAVAKFLRLMLALRFTPEYVDQMIGEG